MSKFPEYQEFTNNHCSQHTYYYHVYKCSSPDCKYHTPLKGVSILPFPDPVPYTDSDGVEHYKEGKDVEETFLPSKLIDATKRKSNIPFPKQR